MDDHAGMIGPESHLQSLIARVAAARRSLRTAPPRTFEDPPAEEYERLRSERRLDALEFLRVCVVAWAISDGLAVLSGAAFLARHRHDIPGEWWRVLTPGFFSLLALVTASTAAAVTLNDFAVLPKRWLAAGLLPWIVLATECAALLPLLL